MEGSFFYEHLFNCIQFKDYIGYKFVILCNFLEKKLFIERKLDTIVKSEHKE